MKRKPDPLLQVPAFIKRPHYACRLREDLANAMRSECKRLNCSQGVWLEIAITKALLGNLVTQNDAYEYSSNARWIHRMLDTMKQEGLDLNSIRALKANIATIIIGEDHK